MVHCCIPTTKERRARLAECMASINDLAGTPVMFHIYENYREGFVQPLRKILQELPLDALVWCIGDDTRLTEKDTIKRLEARFWAEYPNGDGVVQPDDGIQRGAIITMPLCTVETMYKYGTYDGFFLNFCDNLFTEVMEKKGKYTYCPEIHVEHQHHINKKAPMDDTYAFAQTKYAEDRELYFKLKASMGL